MPSQVQKHFQSFMLYVYSDQILTKLLSDKIWTKILNIPVALETYLFLEASVSRETCQQTATAGRSSLSTLPPPSTSLTPSWPYHQLSHATGTLTINYASVTPSPLVKKNNGCAMRWYRRQDGTKLRTTISSWLKHYLLFGDIRTGRNNHLRIRIDSYLAQLRPPP
jgi:hypothetical protein